MTQKNQHHDMTHELQHKLWHRITSIDTEIYSDHFPKRPIQRPFQIQRPRSSSQHLSELPRQEISPPALPYFISLTIVIKYGHVKEQWKNWTKLYGRWGSTI
jgi:hypothetical protein